MVIDEVVIGLKVRVNDHYTTYFKQLTKDLREGVVVSFDKKSGIVEFLIDEKQNEIMHCDWLELVPATEE